MTHKHATILHGMPSKEEFFDIQQPNPVDAHWIPWLKSEIEELGIVCTLPAMPKPYEPTYDQWGKTFDSIYKKNEPTLVVGHSLGAGFILQWLTLNPTKSIKNIILVAPWIDPDHEIDFFGEIKGVEQEFHNFHILYSTDDDQDILDSVNLVQHKNPTVKIHKYHDKGHFTSNDLGKNSCIELLKIIKGSL
jgi:predicted alpha/beta hydrolase family esterase